MKAEGISPPWRSREICRLSNMYGVEVLLHFTHIESLFGIFKYGLSGLRELREKHIKGLYVRNDPKRLDGNLDAVCLSIGRPNDSLFRAYRIRQREGVWVFLELNPRVLYELDCAFYPDNAASLELRNIPVSELKTVAAFRKMFAGQDQQLPGYPPNPQAEVHVFETIPPEYIDAINFEHQSELMGWSKSHANEVPPHTLLRLNTKWHTWGKKKRVGKAFRGMG